MYIYFAAIDCDEADKFCFCSYKDTACSDVGNSTCDTVTDQCKCNVNFTADVNGVCQPITTGVVYFIRRQKFIGAKQNTYKCTQLITWQVSLNIFNHSVYVFKLLCVLKPNTGVMAGRKKEALLLSLWAHNSLPGACYPLWPNFSNWKCKMAYS